MKSWYSLLVLSVRSEAGVPAYLASFLYIHIYRYKVLLIPTFLNRKHCLIMPIAQTIFQQTCGQNQMDGSLVDNLVPITAKPNELTTWCP